MPKTFEFEGQHYDFPDDVSDNEALSFLNNQHPAPLTAASKLAKGGASLSLKPPSLPEAPPPSMFERAGDALSSGFDTVSGWFNKPREAVQKTMASGMSYLPGMDNPVQQEKLRKVSSGEASLGQIVGEDLFPSGFINETRGFENGAGNALWRASQHAGAIGKGITELGTDMASDPLTYGLVGVLKKAGLGGEALQKAIAFGFAVQMGSEVPPEMAHVKELYDAEGWSPKVTKALTDTILHTGMAGMAAAHATAPGKSLPVAPKAPGTLESLVQESTPLDRRVGEVLPEAPVPEGVSFPTEGRELEQRFKAAQRETKALESDEAGLAAQADKERFKAAQLEVENLEKQERAAQQVQKANARLERQAELERFKAARQETSSLEAAEEGVAANEARDFSHEKTLVDQIERAQAAEEARRRKDAETFPNPVGDAVPDSGIPNLPEPPGETPGLDLGRGAQGGGGEAGALNRGSLPEAPLAEGGTTETGSRLPGAATEGPSLVQPGRAALGEAGSERTPAGAEALEPSARAGTFRRSQLTDNEHTAAAAALNDLRPNATRAEILARLSQGDMPVKLRPAGSRIQKVAAEVERRLAEKSALPEAPELTEVSGFTDSKPSLPKPPKTFEERMLEGREWNVAEAGSDAELAAAMDRNLSSLREEQAVPTQFDKARVGEETALRAREAATQNPSYEKVAGVLNHVRQLWGEELGTREGQDFRTFFDVAPAADTGNLSPVKGYTSRSGRGVGADPFTLAKEALVKSPQDPVRGLVSQSLATMFHENLHELDKGTAHTDLLESSTGRANAREQLAGMKDGNGAPLFTPEELGRIVPEGAEKLSQGEKFKFMHALFDKVSGGAFDGLVDAMKTKLSAEDVASLAAEHGKLSEGLRPKAEGEAPLAEAGNELPKAPDELDMKNPERGAAATDVPKVLAQGALKGFLKSGTLAARTQMANLAGGLYTVLNNTINAGGKIGAHQLSDAIWGAIDAKSEGKSRVSARFKALGDLPADALDTIKLKFQKEPALSESGKDLEALRTFGKKHLPRLTDQTFGQFAGEAAHLGGESAKGPVEAAFDRATHTTMLPAIISERAVTANQVKTGMSALMEREGLDLQGLIKKAETSPKLQQEIKNVYARAAGEANAMRFGRNAFRAKGSSNWGDSAVQLWNKTPGWAQVGISNLIGTPFVKAVVANAFTDFVEFMPVMNQLSKRVRTAPELKVLEEKSLKGTLDKEGKRRLHELQENGPYGKDFIRGQQAIGPLALSMGLAAGIYAASKSQPGTIKSGEDEGGTKRKSLVGSLGSANPWYALGEFMGRAYKGDDPRFQPSLGKVPGAATQLAGDLSQQRGGQSTLGELLKTITSDSAEQQKLKTLVDKYMSDLGRTAVPAAFADLAEAGLEEKRPDLPTKGETPGLSAFGRGAASRVPKLRESVTTAIDTTTGNPKKVSDLPGPLEFPARERYVSRLTEFLDAHKGQMEGGVFTPRQHGLESFDQNQFDFWKKGLKDESRVVVGRSPNGALKRLSIDTILRDDSIPDRVKAELLQDALPALVKESTNYATREALKASKASGAPPEIPDESVLRELRKAEEEKILRDYGVPAARRRRLPPSSRGLSKGEKKQFQESLPEAPAP